MWAIFRTTPLQKNAAKRRSALQAGTKTAPKLLNMPALEYDKERTDTGTEQCAEEPYGSHSNLSASALLNRLPHDWIRQSSRRYCAGCLPAVSTGGSRRHSLAQVLSHHDCHPSQ